MRSFMNRYTTPNEIANMEEEHLHPQATSQLVA
jgi:hypothetical protein